MSLVLTTLLVLATAAQVAEPEPKEATAKKSPSVSRDNPAKEVVELEKFRVTSTRRAAGVLDVSEALTLLNQAEITRRAPDVLAEALRGQVGTFSSKPPQARASPALHGADAMGGVVSVITKEPQFIGAEWQSQARLYGSADSVDQALIGRVEAAKGTAGIVKVHTAVAWFYIQKSR